MKGETKVSVAAAILVLAVAMFYTFVTNKPSNVVHLLFVPALLYLGYSTGKARPGTWIGVAVITTVGMAAIYAFF